MSLVRLRLRHGQRSADASLRSLDVAGSDPHLGKTSIGAGEDGAGQPHPPAATGSLPANSPSRKGVERRFEAAEDVLADHLAAGLSGIAGQDRDAPVPARRLAFPHGPAFGLGLPGTDHDGRPSIGWRAECRSGVRGMLPRPEVNVQR